MTFKKFFSLTLAAMILIIAFSSFSFAVFASDADLTLAPKTEAEMETAILESYKAAIKERKNETKSGKWAQTSFTVSLDFKNFTDKKYRVEDGTIKDASYVFTLEIFTVLGNMRELDYEFLILKGGDADGTNTFSISFDGISVTVKNQEILKMNVTYTLTWGETKAESERVMEYCKEVVKERVGADMSLEKKIKTLHDFMASSFKYATTELENGDPGIYYPIYMIENGKGVCQAYTALFNRLMEAAGIGENELAVRHDSFADNGSGRIGHAWNMVEIDGAWYHIDTTWDDSGRSVRYNYYLKSDESFAKDHFWRADFYPTAEYNYGEGGGTTSKPSSDTESSEASRPTSSETESSTTPESSVVTESSTTPESSVVTESSTTPESSVVTESSTTPESSVVTESSTAPESSDVTEKPSTPQSSGTESDELNCSGLPSWNNSDITSENTTSVTEAEGFTLGFTETALIALAAVLLISLTIAIAKSKK